MKKFHCSIFLFFLFFLACHCIFGQSAAARRYFQSSQPAAGEAAPPPPAAVQKADEPAAVQDSVPEFEPEFSAAIQWASRHVREGWTRCDGPVGIAQFEFSEQMGYLGVLSVYDFSGAVGRKYRFEETRFYAGISVPIAGRDSESPMMLDLNWSWLHYPDRSGELNSCEITLALNAPKIYGGDKWMLGYGISLIHDYDLEESSIVQAVTYSRLLTESGNLDLDICAELHWGDTAKLQGLTRRECDGGAFHAAVLTAGINWLFSEDWQLTPYIAASFMTDNRARKAAENNDMNSACTIWGGIKIATRF